MKLRATVLYADLDDSTGLVDTKRPLFAAEVFKAFLRSAAKIIRSEGGEITAYDGDRVMAVFLGDHRNTAAARTALKLNHVRHNIINPAIARQYGSGTYTLRHVVGVDTSILHVAKTGIRGSNDLVWVGRAANHAAKLCVLSSDYASRVTSDVYDVMNRSVKYSGNRSMWEKVTWNTTGRTIYRSSWIWQVD
jgi:class 3 adenylate cyclase